MVDLLPKLVWHMDEPVADPAAISTYLICSAARERLTVMLSGMGGDEIFAGYPRYLAARLAQVARRRCRAGARARLRGDASRTALTLGRPGRAARPAPEPLKLLARHRRCRRPSATSRTAPYYTHGGAAGAAQPGRCGPSSTDHDPLARHRRYFERVAGEHWLNQLLYVDAKTFLPCLNLAYTDKMSMAASTEVRVPLLDDELVASPRGSRPTSSSGA